MKQDIKIFMEDCVVVNNRIYFFSKYWNALYVVDLKTKTTELVSTMPEEKIWSRRLCAGIVYYNKKLILVPMLAKKIWVFDLESNQWLGIKRAFVTNEEVFHGEIFRAIVYQERLFLVGSNYPAIIRMDLNTYELEYLTEPYTFLRHLKIRNECYFRSDFCLNENRLLIASCVSNHVLSVNLDTFQFQWYEVGEKEFCYSGIAWDGENYWLSPRAGTPIIKWDGKDGVEYISLPETFDEKIYNFLGVQYQDEKLIFPGMLQDKTLTIDPYPSCKVHICEGQYSFYRCLEEGVVVFQRADGLLQLKNLMRKEQHQFYCKVPYQDFCEYIEKHLMVDENSVIGTQTENTCLSLPIFFAFLKKGRNCADKKLGIGENIWANIRN
ncbi:MAG: hypothetical protein HFH53_00860 [Hespellia sp.]|nr:hypothetical protein [Hespellia sp.]